MEKIVNDYFGFQLFEGQTQVNELFNKKKDKFQISEETKKKINNIYQEIEKEYKVKIDSEKQGLDKYDDFDFILSNIAITVLHPEIKTLNSLEDYQKLTNKFKKKFAEDTGVNIDKELEHQVSLTVDKNSLGKLKSFAQKTLKK